MICLSGAKREFRRLTKILTFGDEFIQSYTGYTGAYTFVTKAAEDKEIDMDGYAMAGLYELSCVFAEGRSLAMLLHEEEKFWTRWKEAARQYRETQASWLPRQSA